MSQQRHTHADVGGHGEAAENAYALACDVDDVDGCGKGAGDACVTAGGA